jgi:transposase
VDVWLSTERARLDEEPDDLLQLSPVWRAREELLQRLRAAGKAPKVALVAAMRKLLTLLNAMVHDGTPWRPAAASEV